MHLSNALFVCATFIAVTVAQNPTTTSLHFTTIPTSLVAGVKQTIGWAGGNGNSVNIILQQGLASNLQDLPIPPIASGVEGNSTTWTPPKSLPDAGNYALRIEQGEDSVNYSGMLQLFGGCSTCPTNAAAALASISASKPSTGSATASSTASTSSNSGARIPVISSGSKSSNSTGAAGSSGNSTITGSSLNSTTSTGSVANVTTSGTNSTANSTLSSAKLHATSSKSSSSASSTASSTSSSSSGSTSSSTGSSTSPSATKKSSGVTVAASNFALVLCAIVGVVYLG